MTKQVSARDNHILSSVDQMRHPGSYEHIGCNGQGLHHDGNTLSVASMQKSVHLQKIVAILATVGGCS